MLFDFFDEHREREMNGEPLPPTPLSIGERKLFRTKSRQSVIIYDREQTMSYRYAKLRTTMSKYNATEIVDSKVFLNIRYKSSLDYGFEAYISENTYCFYQL